MTRINQCLQIRPRLVQERQALLISRYGKFTDCLGVELHFTVPFVDRVVKTVSMEEQFITIIDQSVVSEDKLEIKLHAKFSLKVLNPKKATFEVEDYLQATIDLVQKALSAKYKTFKLVNGKEIHDGEGSLIALKNPE